MMDQKTDMTAAELDELEKGLRLTGGLYYADALASLRKQLDEAREREASAIKRAAWVAKHACLVPPDGGSPTQAECDLCDEAERRILALSQEPPASHAPGNGSKIIGALEQAARGEAARVTVVEVASPSPVLRDADTAPAPAISGGEMARTLRDVLAWLDDPRMGQWPYMEGGDFDMDRSSHAEFIRNLLAAADRSAS